jgi:hypothetical protein
MAKYTVTHSCGHTQVHELFGPGKERERKLDWFGRQECTECWKVAKRAAEKTEPVSAELIYNAFSNGAYLAVTSGDTFSIKDALKAAGCRWMEYQDNNDLLGINKPRKAWMMRVDVENDAELTAAIQCLMDAGVTEFRDTLNPLTVAVAQHLAEKVSNHA